MPPAWTSHIAPLNKRCSSAWAPEAAVTACTAGLLRSFNSDDPGRQRKGTKSGEPLVLMAPENAISYSSRECYSYCQIWNPFFETVGVDVPHTVQLHMILCWAFLLQSSLFGNTACSFLIYSLQYKKVIKSLPKLTYSSQRGHVAQVCLDGKGAAYNVYVTPVIMWCVIHVITPFECTAWIPKLCTLLLH